MTYGQSDTAILIFTCTAGEEAFRKKYASGHSRNVTIAGTFIRNAIHTASTSGLPVVVKYSNQQTGKTFGERLANSIEEILAMGYSRVIVSGSDIPNISSSHYTTVNELLDAHEVVVGPSADGGIYILGVSARGYQRKMILDIPWQTADVHSAFEPIAPGRQIARLEVLEDIDNYEDLFRWIVDRDTPGFLLSVIRTILFSPARRVLRDTAILFNGYLPTIGQRGPPYMVAATT